MRLYPHFILPMRRSRGFASARPDSRPVQTRFPSGYGAAHLNPPVHASRRIIIQKARHQAAFAPPSDRL